MKREMMMQDGALLLSQVSSLTGSWEGSIERRYCHLSNVSALLKDYFPNTNWTGFYIREKDSDHLVLGPFQGKVACTDIDFKRGVCGKAASTGQSQLVADVHCFEGHIACDGASRSELVVPIFASDGQVVAVIDLDSPSVGRFSKEDQLVVERIASLLSKRLWA
ncbi:GAF domain-containing protein [Sphaerochaeta pleomorpha str. Grapes]|uniref:GAF domain-containing protein n=1 Tax=Sphaerochaeta pleomorpha (strain ATCC BAA-1885 / DSM 22778 / Grapes) TaxID=158190 RepID=G8QR32_SPHPG|nr:GAF domain-containing protein [Sphaerochaeta pleomorpha]AEV29880.1 GAF domain-containing protein [Sphaerochaeta pleomorpha str. Grapes]